VAVASRAVVSAREWRARAEERDRERTQLIERAHAAETTAREATATAAALALTLKQLEAPTPPKPAPKPQRQNSEEQGFKTREPAGRNKGGTVRRAVSLGLQRLIWTDLYKKNQSNNS
jgi:hypothetical protein